MTLEQASAIATAKRCLGPKLSALARLRVGENGALAAALLSSIEDAESAADCIHICAKGLLVGSQVEAVSSPPTRGLPDTRRSHIAKVQAGVVDPYRVLASPLACRLEGSRYLLDVDPAWEIAVLTPPLTLDRLPGA